MLLKTIIVILLIANVVVLGSAFVSMMQDQGKGTNRTAKRLFLRVGLAALMLLVVVYGIWTGELGMNAPWLHRN